MQAIENYGENAQRRMGALAAGRKVNGVANRSGKHMMRERDAGNFFKLKKKGTWRELVG